MSTSHFLEQVIRFTSRPWAKLDDERRAQLAFNLGAVAAALSVPKKDGYDVLTAFREGRISTEEIHTHFRTIARVAAITLSEEQIVKPF